MVNLVDVASSCLHINDLSAIAETGNSLSLWEESHLFDAKKLLALLSKHFNDFQ